MRCKWRRGHKAPQFFIGGKFVHSNSPSVSNSELHCRLLQASLRFPYVNEQVENQFEVNRSIMETMTRFARKGAINMDYDFRDHVLNYLCIRSPNKSWKVSDDIVLAKCQHSGLK